MADILKTSFSIILEEPDKNKTHRLLDNSLTHTPKNRGWNEFEIQGSETDLEIITDSHYVFIHCENGTFNIKLNDTTNPEHTNMKSFMYDGAALTSVFVSNPNTDPIKIEYVFSKY